VTLASIAVPTSADLNQTGLVLVSGAAMLVGIVEWLLPWYRLPRWGTLTLVPVAFGLIALANDAGAVDTYRYGIFFVVVFTWIGIGHPQGTSLAFAPLAAGAYVLPLVFIEGSTALALISVLYTIPVCIFVGESLAWTSARMRQADSELGRQRSEARFRTLVQNASDIITIVAADGTIQYMSSSIHRVLGYRAEERIGRHFFDFIHPDDRARVTDAFAKFLPNPGIAPPVQFRAAHTDGSWRHLQSLASNLLEDAEVKGVVINSRDITDQKLLEAELVHQAFHDPLTGLPNRALFMDRVGHALARSNRLPASIAVLFLDLDNFKVVNDSLGHVLGDALLVAVGRRLASHVRPMDTVARLGGDEFTVLAEDLPDADDAARLAGRLVACLTEPFTIAHRHL
jgi:diguanylate cyclase (GGDEF)-like protein/PAS domain S-box-containing protein